MSRLYFLLPLGPEIFISYALNGSFFIYSSIGVNMQMKETISGTILAPNIA